MGLFLGLCGLTPAVAQGKRSDSVEVVIRLDNSINKNAPVDSVLVIFDRVNLTEAGAIRQIVYPVNNVITLKNAPEGRFYITVVCLGIYNDNFTEINYVYEGRKNQNRFRFRMSPAEAFRADGIKIPTERTNPLQFAIFKQKMKK